MNVFILLNIFFYLYVDLKNLFNILNLLSKYYFHTYENQIYLREILTINTSTMPFTLLMNLVWYKL